MGNNGSQTDMIVDSLWGTHALYDIGQTWIGPMDDEMNGRRED